MYGNAIVIYKLIFGIKITIFHNKTYICLITILISAFERREKRAHNQYFKGVL